jgi:dTDP-4-amino-4,6-dideoxygalactose transaminase
VASDAAAFSFYPTKNLGALGDGGALVTGRADVAERARQLRQYGWRTSQMSEELGWNSRLDELQAAILRAKLSHLPELVRRRREAADAYLRALGDHGVAVPATSSDSTHSFHHYVIRVSGRDRLRRHLAAQGIETAIHYPVPAHRQPAYAAASRLTTLHETERAATEILSLPMSSTLTTADATAIGEIVQEFVASEGEEPS